MKTKIKIGQRVISWKGIFGECGTVIGIVKSIKGIFYEIELDDNRGKVYDKIKNIQSL